jgi:dTDP-L-rhamnose 4-epimerase
MKMKILVTGGAGFIGKWLLEKLPAEIEVVVVDSLDEQVHPGRTGFPGQMAARAQCVRADVRDTRLYAAAAEGVDVVVHLAAQTGTGQSMYALSRYVEHNVDGTAKLLELLRSLKRQPRRIILASSRAVYGEGSFGPAEKPHASPGRRGEDLQAGRWGIYDPSGTELAPLPMREDHLLKPTSVYGLTKLWQEQLVENQARSLGIDFLVFRFQNVYGPGQALGNPYTGIIGIFVNALMNGRDIELFEDGKMTRDFVYVEDVASAIANTVVHPGTLGTVVNCGSGQAVTLWDLVRHMETVTGKKARVNCSGKYRMGDVRHAVADMRRYRQILGAWTPRPLAAGLQKYCEWYMVQAPVSERLVADSLREMGEKGLLGSAARNQQ